MQSAVWSVCSVQCGVWSVECAVCSVECAVWNVSSRYMNTNTCTPTHTTLVMYCVPEEVRTVMVVVVDLGQGGIRHGDHWVMSEG